MLVVKEDITVNKRQYAHAGCMVVGNDVVECPVNQRHGNKWTLWARDTELRWHITGETYNEEDAKEWIQEEYTKECGTFVARHMGIAHWLYLKYYMAKEPPTIIGNMFLDLLFPVHLHYTK